MWATEYIKKLSEISLSSSVETIEFRPRGNSMNPLIISGDLVVVEPITPNTVLVVGDIVLCKVKGKQFLHLISAIQEKKSTKRYQISNNRGFVNGWIGLNAIFGRLKENKSKVERARQLK